MAQPIVVRIKRQKQRMPVSLVRFPKEAIHVVVQPIADESRKEGAPFQGTLDGRLSTPLHNISSALYLYAWAFLTHSLQTYGLRYDQETSSLSCCLVMDVSCHPPHRVSSSHLLMPYPDD